MKNLVMGSLLVGTILFMPVASQADAPLPLPAPMCISTINCDRDPEHLKAFIASFYKWYTTFWYEPIKPGPGQTLDDIRNKRTGQLPQVTFDHEWANPKDQPIVKKAVTTRFFNDFLNIASVDNTDADPLTCMQDDIDGWSENLSVTIVSVAEKKAQFKVNYGFPPHDIRMLLVTLRLSKKKWLIDEVKDIRSH